MGRFVTGIQRFNDFGVQQKCCAPTPRFQAILVSDPRCARNVKAARGSDLNRTIAGCGNIQYPSETHLILKSFAILFDHNLLLTEYLNGFEILHRTRQHHCLALYTFSKRFNNYNQCSGQENISRDLSLRGLRGGFSIPQQSPEGNVLGIIHTITRKAWLQSL